MSAFSLPSSFIKPSSLSVKVRHFLFTTLASLFVLFITTLIGRTLFYLLLSNQLPEIKQNDLLQAWLWGIRFDLSLAALLVFVIYLLSLPAGLLKEGLFSRLYRLGVTSAIGLLLMLHGSDVIYYLETGRHLGYEMREGANSLVESTLHAFMGYPFISWLHLMLAAIGSLSAYIFFIKQEKPPLQTRKALLITLAIITLPLVILMRGGLGNIPLEPLHAQQIGSQQQATLALNGAYNAIYSSMRRKHIRSELPLNITPEDERRFQQIYPQNKQEIMFPPETPDIVLIFLEGWSAAYMQSYGYPEVTTPYFDQLRERSFTTNGLLAGGHRTTEGLFSTLCSWQNPLGKSVAQTQLQQYSYRCLPHILADSGYHSLFLQGTNQNTSGVGAFTQLLGFQQSMGKDEIETHTLPHNSWGMHDPDIYAEAKRHLKMSEAPLLIGINTNSTHDHQLPENIHPKFGIESRESRYKSLLHYADNALKGFITSLEENPQTRDTLFVILSDHAGMSPDSAMARYWVPFLIYGKNIESHHLNLLASQRDVAPTLLQILGVEVPDHFSGQSLLTSDNKPFNHFSDLYHQGELWWSNSERLYQIPLHRLQKEKCHLPINSPLQLPQKVNCNAEDRKHIKNARAFTLISQKRLFTGKIGRN